MKSKRKNILLISFIFSPNIGGVESHLDDLCEYLTKKGYYIVVLTSQPFISKVTAPFFEKKKNLEIRRIVWFRFSFFNRLEKVPLLEVLYLVPPMLLYAFWYLLFNRRNIDLIQVHGFNMAIVGVIVSYFFRKKFIINTHVSFHFVKNSFYSNVLTFVLNRASCVLVLTSTAKRELEKISVDQKKIVLYHQWINEKLFQPKDKSLSRKKFNLTDESFVVCFAGRFVPAKGVHILLSATKKLNKNIVVTFIGSGPLRNIIEKAAEKSTSIRLIGQIARRDLPYYYSAADVCIIPSIQASETYSEGIPRVLIESLTCGTPVVATRSGGISEFIDSTTGFLVNPNANSVVDLIAKLSNKKGELKNMSKNCIKFARTVFDKEKNGLIIERSLDE